MKPTIEKMAANNYQWSLRCGAQSKAVGVDDIDAITNQTAQVVALTKIV